MSQNISKYVQINDYLLIEYIINKEDIKSNFSDIKPCVYRNINDEICVYDTNNLSTTNNTLKYLSLPTNNDDSNWFFKNKGSIEDYNQYINSYENPGITTGSYVYDTIKIHILSGYNFQDIFGFLLRFKAKSDINGDVTLGNFTWAKQLEGIKYSSNNLYIGSRFYDKYIEVKIPSIYNLGNDWYRSSNNNISIDEDSLPYYLKINSLSDLIIEYSIIDSFKTSTNSYDLYNIVNAQFQIQSNADNFNLFIAESNEGDFIEYFATWNNSIIGNSIMNQIESGQIPLYTSNNPNNNWEDFNEYYGMDARKWIINHELTITESSPLDTQISVPQKYNFTQDSDFDVKNVFRPVLLNSDISTGFVIQYTCRLTNRMDGTQIIRSGTFSSTSKKYGKYLNSINVNNINKYQVFNKSNDSSNNIIINNSFKTKYVKLYYNLSNIELNENKEYIKQGLYTLNLLNSDSLYKFKFVTNNSVTNEKMNLDLSGSYNYAFVSTDSNGNRIEIYPTYSSNMNLVLGEIEFKISKENTKLLLNVLNENKYFSIIIKNINKTESTLFEGTYQKYVKN